MMQGNLRRTFVLAGNGSYANRGCEAILRGTTTLLRESVGECRFISNYFPRGKLDMRRESDRTVVHRPFPRKHPIYKFLHQLYVRRVMDTFRQSLESADAVLMLGGDNFTLGPSRSPGIHFKLLTVAHEQGVPAVIWGASIGPFSSDPGFERWAAKELAQVPLICARETATQEYLASIGVKQNVMLAADPAFYLEPSPCELPPSIEGILQEGCIGLTLNGPLFRSMQFAGSRSKQFFAWVSTAIDNVRQLSRRSSLPILLIPHSTSSIVGRYRKLLRPLAPWIAGDRIFAQIVARQVEESDRVFALGVDLDAGQTKWVISRVQVFAGARTHSTFAAISSGVPTICVSHSMKARGVCRDVYGDLDWLIDACELKDPSVLCDRVMSLYERRAELTTKIENMNTIFRSRARQATGELIDLIS